MSRPTGRVLTLLELLQSGGTRTVAELADRLGVDGRTVRRYVDHLIDLGVPVESVRGRYGGYRVGPGHRVPPLMFTDDEALAVVLGLAAGRRSGLATADRTAGETASAKIRRVLPKPVASRLETLWDALAITGDTPSAASDESAEPDADTLLGLADAVRHRRPVALRYTDRDGRTTRRTLHPAGIVAHGGRWYVSGTDAALGETRTFRLDRVADVRILPGAFDEPFVEDVAEQVVSGFATADYRYEVLLRIEATIPHIRARFPASLAVLEEEPETGWVRARLRAERLDWLPPLLAALDRPFVVEQPEELRGLVAALAQRLASYARPG